MSANETTATRSQRAFTSAESNFWGLRPLVTSSSGQPTGHVRAEVWADGFVCFAMTSPTLVPAAAAALMGGNAAKTPAGPLPSAPVMMQRSGQEFLGRVAVEFFDTGSPAIGAFGDDQSQLLALSRERLSQLG